MLHQTVGYSRIFEFDYPSVQVSDDLDVSDLRGELRLTRTSQGLYAAGAMQALAQAECVRCLTSFRQGLAIVFDDLFVYPPSRASEPLLAIPETALLDLRPLTREYMLLAFPLQPLCRPDCKGLCPDCGVNWNEAGCEHGSAESERRRVSRLGGSPRALPQRGHDGAPPTTWDARGSAAAEKAEFMVPYTPSGRAAGRSRSLLPRPLGRAAG